MRVRIIQHQGYFARDGSEYPCGTEADLADDLAVKLCGYGIAVPAPKPVVETAEAAPAPEKEG